MLSKILNRLFKKTPKNDDLSELRANFANHQQYLMEQGSTFLWKLSNTCHHFGSEIVEAHRSFENGNVHDLKASSALVKLYSLEQGEFLQVASEFLVANPEQGFGGLIPLHLNGSSYEVSRQVLADVIFAVMVLRMDPSGAVEYVLKVKPITLH